MVSTACYVARTYGIHSAMPMFKARALCPHATIISPNMQKYVRVGREVRSLMFELTPQVEPLSIDEAFMDLTGTQRLHGMTPARSLARFARRVEAEIGITVSIGLSANKFLAKIASDMDKPRGFAVLGKDEAVGVPGAKAGRLHLGRRQGQRGAAAARRLQHRRRPAARRRDRPDEALRRRRAAAVAALARHRRARRQSRARNKSVSAETTFGEDIASYKPLEKILWSLSERVSARLKSSGIAGSTVTLKLKTADFRIRTRARSLGEPTQLAARIFAAGKDLLARETDGTRFRLIGIGLSNLDGAEKADAADLIDLRRSAPRTPNTRSTRCAQVRQGRGGEGAGVRRNGAGGGRGGGLRRRSPDGAKRNPGSPACPRHRPRIARSLSSGAPSARPLAPCGLRTTDLRLHARKGQEVSCRRLAESLHP